MKILSVSHVPYEGMGSFEPVLKQRGGKIETLLSYRDDIGDVKADAHDLAIILGGPMGVYQADIFPFLNKEIDFISRRLEKNLPTLGICLGAQLMAKALGAGVYPGKQGKEIGWFPLAINADGKNSPVRHFGGDQTMMMHWHGDTFDFPLGATLLASSEKYDYQAYKYGNALGLQCHPEVTQESLEFWIVSGGFDAIEKSGSTVPEFRAKTKEYSKTLNRQAALFLNDWLDEVKKRVKPS